MEPLLELTQMNQNLNKSIALTGFIFMVALILYARYVAKKSKCIDDAIYTYRNYTNGIVLEKYINRKDRGIPIIKLSNNKIIKIFSYDKIGIFKEIDVGDSIFKKSNSYIFQVYRGDSFFVYDFSKDCCRIDGSGCN